MKQSATSKKLQTQFHLPQSVIEHGADAVEVEEQYM